MRYRLTATRAGDACTSVREILGVYLYSSAYMVVHVVRRLVGGFQGI